MATDAAGKMLVFSHPNSKTNRDHMTVFSSVDGGASWALAVLVDANSSAYSSIIALRNGSYAVQFDVGKTHMHRCSAPPAGRGCGESFAIITFDERQGLYNGLKMM